MIRLRAALMLLMIPSFLGCGGDREIVVRFAGLVGAEPAACGATYDGVGVSSSTLTLRDLRLYLHDVRVVTDDGREVAVELLPNDFQDERVVLLDFEDGSSDCVQGTTRMNTEVRGTIADDAVITGVRFRLGVPEDINHRDVSTAQTPLNLQSMYWGWNGGYKFLRVDAASTGLPGGFFVHLGSTGCEGDMRGNVTGCVQENRTEVALSGFDPEAQTVAVDVAALLSGSDIDVDQSAPALCMSGFDDLDCAPVFDRLGLAFAGSGPTGEQRFFRVIDE